MENHLEFRRKEFASFLRSRNSLPPSPTNARPRCAQVDSETFSLPSTTTAITTTPSSNTIRAPAFVLPPLPPSPFTTTSELTTRPHPTPTVSHHSAPTSSTPVSFPSAQERAIVYQPVSKSTPTTLPPLSTTLSNSPTTVSYGTSFPPRGISTILSVDGVQEIKDIGSQSAVHSTNASFPKTDIGSGKKRPRDGHFSDEGEAPKVMRTSEKTCTGTTSPVAISNVINTKTPSPSDDKIKSKDKGNSSSNGSGKGKKEVRHYFHQQLITKLVSL